MDDSRYFSKSWKMMTAEKGWIKPLLVMAVATLVPVAGVLGVSGYTLEWARLTAWGADTSPKRKGVRVGELIATGWRGFCASILWVLVWTLAAMGVSYLFYLTLGNAGSWLAQTLISVASLFVSIIVSVATLRAIIYAKASAALNPSRVFEMVGRDPKGLFKIVLIPFLGSLIVSVIVGVMTVVIMALVASDIYQLALYSARSASRARAMGIDPGAVLTGIVLKSLIPALVFGYASSVVSAAVGLLTTNSVALWFRQFNVPAWGGPDEPLPPTRPVLPPSGGFAASGSQQGWYQQPATQYPQGAYPQGTPQPTYPQAAPQPGAPQAQQPGQPGQYPQGFAQSQGAYPQGAPQQAAPQAQQSAYPQPAFQPVPMQPASAPQYPAPQQPGYPQVAPQTAYPQQPDVAPQPVPAPQSPAEPVVAPQPAYPQPESQPASAAQPSPAPAPQQPGPQQPGPFPVQEVPAAVPDDAAQPGAGAPDQSQQQPPLGQ